MLTVKEGVRFKAFPPAMLYMLRVLERASRMHFEVPEHGLVITSANDGRHAMGSQHYSDTALDVRSKSFRSAVDKHTFRGKLATDLGDQFTVLFEYEGGEQEHFHCQVRKSHTYIPERE